MAEQKNPAAEAPAEAGARPAKADAFSSGRRGKVHYANFDKANSYGYDDFNVYLEKPAKGMGMDGFDPVYKDIVDYIIRCTHRIWEEKGTGLIYTHYNSNTRVYSGTDISEGVAQVVSNTIQFLHAVPDRLLLAQNVIWSGDDKTGFFSSHRLDTVGTNTGYSIYGQPTGRKLRYTVIADCAVKQNRITEEWLVRDNLHIINQLGLDPVAFAKKLAKGWAGSNSHFQNHFGMMQTKTGQMTPGVYAPRSTSFEIGDFILSLYNRLWEWKRLDEMPAFFADNAVMHGICDQRMVGRDEIAGFMMSMLASLPNAEVVVERVTCNEREFEKGQWDVAVRWRLQGQHEGFGYFRDPSNKPVVVQFIQHLRVVDEKVAETWLVFDAIDVLKQVVAGQADDE